ncbi:MAG: histidine kinase [Bacteroidetes bacterium]|nr:histidine kinase [Bacteroidota bacterium]
MKKLILLLPLFLILVQTVHAQIKWGEYSQSYQTGSDNNTSTVALIIAIHNTNDSFWVTNNSGSLHESLLKDSLFLRSRSNFFIAVNTFDSTDAQFFLHGVNKKNANEYEFRVLEKQDKIIVPWSVITKFGSDIVRENSIIKSAAYLGGYKTKPGSKLIVDVRKKGSSKIITSAVVRWVPISPILLNIYTANELNEFLKRLKQFGSNRLSVEEINKWKSRYPTDQLDVVTSLPKKLKVAATDNNLIFYLRADIYNKEQVEYELIKDQKVLRSWNINEFDNSFIWLKNLKPGEYLLRVRYSIQREHVMEYPFEIETAWYQSVVFKIIVGILTVAFWGFIIFLILLIKQRKKTARELSNKEKSQLELKAIYAQLNPHFVFNALSSIQGLINNQDIEGANHYLSDFARLMRDSLANSNKDQTSLKEEMITLETYLKLEQLRFGFKYDIKTSDVNIYETEIPSLLLQPLIENAVKHGVSTLKENGIINLGFSKHNNDMIVTIQDNGGGFQYSENMDGYGLKLTNDRIKLLNQIMNGQFIEMHIKEGLPVGTIINLTFKNWFL